MKINRSLGERWTALKESKARRKVDRLRGLPKSRLKRLIWRLNPRRLAEFWFSRDGAIMALKITGIVILFFFIFTLGVFAYFRKDLPDISVSGTKLGGSISYYDRTGQTLLWQDYDAIKRVPVASSDISQFIKDATIVVEDKDFYKHRGFDIRGITRAAFNDIFRKGGKQGGSTITQQLVKLNQDWTQERTVGRKIKEIILAVELERSFTKDEILTGYLNTAPYGSVDYGVQTAAADYFQKSAKDLTLAEAAMLAAIPKSPAIYSPYSPDFDREAFIGRQHYVIDSLLQAHKITKAQADESKKVDVLAEIHPQQTKYAGIRFPYFVLAARDEIKNKFVPSGGSKSTKIGGWKVTTTLDVDLQNIAEEKIRKNLANVQRYGADEQALVAEEVKTGQVVALVGGVDFNNPDHGQLNYAHSVKIAPGSSFKPYDYASLIENTTNSGAGSVLYDIRQPLPGYPCTNKANPRNGGNCLEDYDFRSPGPLTIRYALGGSRNIPAVKAMLIAGVDKTIDLADSMMAAPDAYNCYSDTASTQKTQCYGAAAIGDGAYLHLDQHVNGVATFARMGQAIPSTYILRIQDAVGKPIYEWKQPKATQVIRAETAYIVNNMASDPNASYLPAGYYKWHRYKGWNNAVKTGTTNNSFDGLMMGWNTKYAVGSWVGYHTRDKSLSTFMETLTAPLTRDFMLAALDKSKEKAINWDEPAGIQHLPGFIVRSHVGIGSVEPSPATEIFPSWYRARGSTTQSSTIDKVSNKLATNCTPPLAKQTTTDNGNSDQFSSDTFYGSGAAITNTSQNDDVHSCSDTPPGTPTVTANSPRCTAGSECSFTVTVEQGTHPFNDPQYAQFPGTLNFLIDGQNVKSVSIPDSVCSGSVCSLSITYTPTPDHQGKTLSVTANAIDSVLFQSATSPPISVPVAAAGSGDNPPADGTSNSGGSTLPEVDNNQTN
ncbi:penicillin-binding protein [Candidatus Saccharibacteria bacterium]|nr:penicillin-binding protein [Candidatus Saccharibacteria bacterium]